MDFKLRRAIVTLGKRLVDRWREEGEVGEGQAFLEACIDAHCARTGAGLGWTPTKLFIVVLPGEGSANSHSRIAAVVASHERWTLQVVHLHCDVFQNEKFPQTRVLHANRIVCVLDFKRSFRIHGLGEVLVVDTVVVVAQVSTVLSHVTCAFAGAHRKQPLQVRLMKEIRERRNLGGYDLSGFGSTAAAFLGLRVGPCWAC
eukprot:6251127-Amphidinium_carterae.1